MDDSHADKADVDITLIDEMLRLTPRQRLAQNDRMAALAVRLQTAFKKTRGRPAKEWKSPAR
jgi:hypothetical protein